MAAITRIEVANFLCDGYETGKKWIPLYRGETLRLAGVNGYGSSAAIQIENAGGKTSLTEASLFLLTRNGRLKTRVAARVAPPDNSWTHIRIEFVERPIDDPTQRNLIVITQQDVPGTPYVIGIVWSRNKDPVFYRYQGVLEDAPCFNKDGANLTLIDNETFKASVKGKAGAKWDTWRSAKEWEQEIKLFCDTEVLKQNVGFQLDGAGDYSAVFNKVNNKNGDGYDVNFFRQIVAPELLRDPLGTEAGDGEERFENALLSHLRMSVDRLLDISARQRELDAASAALIKFEPIEQRAQEVIAADRSYKQELDNLARDAAVVDAIVRRKLPGLPNITMAAAHSGNKKLMEALSSIIIAQREGVLITDSGLANLCGIEVGRLNQYARERGINNSTGLTQFIELTDVLKLSTATSGASVERKEGLQRTDNKDVLKKDGRGGRRYGTTMYALPDALLTIDAVANLSGAHTGGVGDILTRAFGIAIDEIDTNPYRREQRRLLKKIEVTNKALAAVKADEKEWAGKYEALMEERTNAETNQIAYETFRTRASANEFLPEHVDDPLSAKKWAEEQLVLARRALGEHHEKVVALTVQYENWNTLNEQHMGAALQGILDSLVAHFNDATSARNAADAELNASRTSRKNLDVTHKSKSKDLTTLTRRCDRLESLASKMPDFVMLFGEADPESLDPGKDLQGANEVLREKAAELQKVQTEKHGFEALEPGVKLFRELFGTADPANLDPARELRDHNEKIRAENEVLADHQPLVEALSLFMDANPSKQPGEWLDDAEKERQALGVEQQENTRRTEEIKRELSELESAAVADDRVYAAALAALETGKVPFVRLHGLITADAGNRQATLLSLFSSALSAPVVDSLEDAEKATEILEQAKLTVPVFLKAPLVEFILRGEYKVSGKLAHTCLVGRRTRQVEILLNPSLVAEERDRLNTEVQDLAARTTGIRNRLRELQPTSTLMEMAVNANKAVDRKSVGKHAEAAKRHAELSALLPALEKRATGIASIDSMRDYAARGGDDSYNTLIAATIPQRESAKVKQEELIAHLQTLTTEEATRSLHAAKDYKREGGDTALSGVRDAIAVLKAAVEELAADIDALDGQINSDLSGNLEKTTKALNLLNQTFQIEKRALNDAILFERTDDLGYMKRSKEHGTTLNDTITQSSNRLNGIDFERAARFVLTSNEGARNIAAQIADAKGKRDAAEAQVKTFSSELVQQNGYAASIKPFVEDLHKLAVAICTQYAKIAGFSDDIRYRMSDITLDSEIMGYTDAIGSACLGEQASTNDVAKAAIANLTNLIGELEIDTRPLAMRVTEKANAFDAFQSKRIEFCEKARSGEINGLQLPEIERIAEARTIEQLSLIHQVKDKIDASIKEHREQLQVFQQAMEESKAATVDNMARFARQAENNLTIMERVMQKSPNARFFVHADVADADKVKDIIESLISTIQEREAAARERGTVALNQDIEQRNREYIDQIHMQIYHKVFSNPSVHFSHKAIRSGEKTRLTGDEGGLSGGQRTALMMMWLIKQADYALTRAVINSMASRRDQKVALRGAQRVMFFDGLFSNLTSEEIISNAFQGLSDVDQNFQLIGLIHNPAYVNNKDIFPVHLVGKRYSATKGDKRHCFMSVDAYENKLGFFQSAYRNNVPKDRPDA